MYCCPHAIRKNGTAVFASPSSASGQTNGRRREKLRPAATM